MRISVHLSEAFPVTMLMESICFDTLDIVVNGEDNSKFTPLLCFGD